MSPMQIGFTFPVTSSTLHVFVFVEKGKGSFGETGFLPCGPYSVYVPLHPVEIRSNAFCPKSKRGLLINNYQPFYYLL